MNPYEKLANAVVLTAVKDYRDARKKLAKGRKNEAALQMKAECENFFKSDLFSIYTDIDGEMLLARLEQEEIK